MNCNAHNSQNHFSGAINQCRKYSVLTRILHPLYFINILKSLKHYSNLNTEVAAFHKTSRHLRHCITHYPTVIMNKTSIILSQSIPYQLFYSIPLTGAAIRLHPRRMTNHKSRIDLGRTARPDLVRYCKGWISLSFECCVGTSVCLKR